MGSYGRNFDFRVAPHGGERGSRFMLSTTADRPIGVPVKYDSSVDTTAYGSGVLGVVLATTAQAPVVTQSGVLVYENAPAGYAGNDPFLTRYSDMDKADKGKLVQVVHGTTVKVVFTNTYDRTFLQTRSYTGRVMVAGITGATATIAVGDYLTPGVGTDADGYWAETATASNGWLRVTAVDNANDELEAVMLF